MKNNELTYQKIAVKLTSDNNKSVGFISLDNVDSSDVLLEIAKECSKIINTVYIDFTDMDNYFISDINSMLKKEDDLSRIDISLSDDMSKLINSLEFKNLFNGLRNSFDLILINEIKDDSLAYLLSKFDDEKILIAYENKTKKSKVLRAKKEFRKLKVPIRGVVYHI